MTDTKPLSQPGAWLMHLYGWLEARGGLVLPAFAFMLGALLSRTFAPVNLFPLVFITIPLMILLIDRAKSGRQAAILGWWVGFGLFTMGMNWVGHSFAQQDAVPEVLAPVAVLIMSAGLALYYGLAFWVASRLWARGALRVLLFAAIWTLVEILRGLMFTGLPWHPVGSLWADWLTVAQSVNWLSVYGLSFLTVLAAGSLVMLVDGRHGLKRFVLPGVMAVVFGAFILAGSLRLAANQTHYQLGITLRLVQANIAQRDKWVGSQIDNHFDKYLQLSRRGDPEGKARGVRLLIWPETAVQRETFDREGSLLRWRVSRLLDYGSFAITGAPRFEHTATGTKFYNSLFAINSKADLYARYDKVKLVPFGEYVPFAGLLNAIGLQQLVGGSAFSKGAEHQTIQLPGIPAFSPLICYEVIFPGQAIASGPRPQWLLNITNDGWFGHTEGPYQHLALARLRAIEEGLPMVRSAGTGVSAVIDAYGRTINEIGLGRQGIMESPLPTAADAPFLPAAARVFFALLLAAVTVLARLVYCWRQLGWAAK